MIERLELKNILSFGPDAPPIELRPLNVLIGPNGSGKSNLLDVIALLQSLPKSLASFCASNGPFREWLRKGSAPGPSRCNLTCALTNPRWQGEYSVELWEVFDAPAYVAHETIREAVRDSGALQDVCDRSAQEVRYSINSQVMDVSDSISGSNPSTQSILSLIRDTARFKALSELAETLSDVQLYRSLPYGRNHACRKPQTTEFFSGRLKEDGSNLNQVLLTSRTKPDVRRAILAGITELNPAITEFNVDVQANQSLLYIEEDGHPVPASRISDGLLRMLCLMAILLDPDAKGTICLEEPEVGLHPDAILLLAKMLKGASSRCQVIVTTHSEVLVDCFSDEPESIVVCERENGSTTMRRLEAEPLKKWLEEYSLAQLWSKGVLGGNRW